MDSIELKKVVQNTLKNLEDHERFGILFELVLAECKKAAITREAFMDIIGEVFNNPMIYDDFRDNSHPMN